MSILIKGMEMPKSCFQCEFRTKIDPDNLMCIISQKTFEERFYHIEHRDDTCPLVPVPEHGDLIDRNVLEKDIDNYIGGEESRARFHHWVQVQSVPSADVQPVRHGRWVEVKGFTGVEAFGYREECVDGFACSVCDKEVDVSEGDFRYCPNCGAKMDGGEAV